MSAHTDAAAALISLHNARQTAAQAIAAAQAEDDDGTPAS